MRVGYLTYGLDRAPTGIGRYVVELLQALANRPDAPEIVLLTTEATDPHGLWRQFPRHPLGGCLLLPSMLTLGNLAVSAAARRLRLDILHDPNGIAPFLGPANGARRVTTLYDAFAYTVPETHNRLDTWRYRWMLPAALRNADAVLTISHASAAELTSHLKLRPEQLRVAHCGVNPRFTPIDAGPARQATLTSYGLEQPYVLYVGGTNPRKNIVRLLAAWEQVVTEHPGVRLAIVGRPQWRTAAIQAAHAAMTARESVMFTGYVPDADLPALYSGAAAFVFPSLAEGFGLPPLEALACGTPVVASTAGALPEVLGDAALLVDPHDSAALAAALRRVLTDQPLRGALRARGLARAAQFSWDAAAATVHQLYGELLGRPTHAA